jgi:hypothetical protein
MKARDCEDAHDAWLGIADHQPYSALARSPVRRDQYPEPRDIKAVDRRCIDGEVTFMNGVERYLKCIPDVSRRRRVYAGRERHVIAVHISPPHPGRPTPMTVSHGREVASKLRVAAR